VFLKTVGVAHGDVTAGCVAKLHFLRFRPANHALSGVADIARGGGSPDGILFQFLLLAEYLAFQIIDGVVSCQMFAFKLMARKVLDLVFFGAIPE